VDVGLIRAAGAVWLVTRRLRYDLLAVVVGAAVMAWLADGIRVPGAAGLVGVLGAVVSLLLAFRIRNAYNRWWNARTLWGGVVANCRSFGNVLITVDDGSPDMSRVIQRMQRKQVRHAWCLAAELRGGAVSPEIRRLTPEDPADATAGELLVRQAAEARDLCQAGHIEGRGRLLMTVMNTAHAASVGALQSIRDEPFPRHYALFIRSLAWVFGILVCAAAAQARGRAGVAVGALVMALFVVAERLCQLIEEPLGRTAFALPMDRFCAGITADLLGPAHPLAQAREQDGATPRWQYRQLE
jgi:ion channel-forming bestrophin family protein